METIDVRHSAHAEAPSRRPSMEKAGTADEGSGCSEAPDALAEATPTKAQTPAAAVRVKEEPGDEIKVSVSVCMCVRCCAVFAVCRFAAMPACDAASQTQPRQDACL